MSHYLKKIKRHPLWEDAFNYVIENNTSSNLPYHNTRHLIKVFNSAIDIADKSELEEYQVIELGIACLFHDINHSGGQLPDMENISIAIKEFQKFFDHKDDQFINIKTSNIINMMWCTEFPKKKEPLNLQQEIIMDSDLIQCYDNDWVLFIIKGLSIERGVDVSRALQDQTNFINNVKYYTKYAQKLHKRKKREYSEELEYLKTIF